ncbi:MAG: DNA-binding response regulator [Desulfobacterales bacterium CG23_combo_of_CG06-09_8_20_14_all_52_9]|nr:MAG: DNA-binding response regulator [Desulfobacterales bacterium CG23_combo_of_CG06-09_8_20_14_all_52_9]
MSKGKILVVDDEEDILELVRYNLEKEGFQITCAASGETAIKTAANETFDLLILDLMLPGIDGLQVTRILKADSKTRHLPILMLSAKGEEADVVTGLEIGADDYVTKPFSPRILLARVRSILRRKQDAVTEKPPGIEWGELTINTLKHTVHAHGEEIRLTYTEFEILTLLARRPGWVFTRTQIVDAVRGIHYAVTDRSVDVQIAGLRKKLGPLGDYIETVRGVGYRFTDNP